MDSPFASKSILPGLSLPRIERGNGDRRRKGQSFEDELAGEHDEPHGRGAPDPPGHPIPPRPTPNAQPAHRPVLPDDEVGVNLDLEA
jgi:hypothetical protein